MAAAVFNTALLVQTHPGADAYETTSRPPADFARRRGWPIFASSTGPTLPPAALQIPLGHPSVASVVIGAKDAEEMRADGGVQRPCPPNAVGSTPERRPYSGERGSPDVSETVDTSGDPA